MRFFYNLSNYTENSYKKETKVIKTEIKICTQTRRKLKQRKTKL